MPNVKVATRLREIHEIPPGTYAVKSAGTVNAMVDELEASFPGIKDDLLLEGGNVRPDVVIYLDGQPISSDATDTSIANVNTIRIIQAMAGG